jgi:hypothetical protein
LIKIENRSTKSKIPFPVLVVSSEWEVNSLAAGVISLWLIPTSF